MEKKEGFPNVKSKRSLKKNKQYQAAFFYRFFNP